MTSLELVKQIVKILDDKKAEDIKITKISDLTILGDYLIIADCSNTTHVRSLVDEVEYQTKQLGRAPSRIEKDTSSNWIILDYDQVIVNIFYKETREYYNLERLWIDGEQLAAEDILSD